MSPWGKAGERITTAQARERARARLAPARRAAAVYGPNHAARTRAARRAWAAGLTIPYMITRYLDYRGLDGPEVDRACGVEEPTVDLWEAGRVYPTWEQLTALADLCRVPVWRFVEDDNIGRVFLCGLGQTKDITPPVTRFDPLALAAAGINPYPTDPPADTNGQGRLI